MYNKIFLLIFILLLPNVYAQQAMFESDEWEYYDNDGNSYFENIIDLFIWKNQPYVEVNSSRPFYLPIYDFFVDDYHITIEEKNGTVLMSQYGLVPIASLRPFELKVKNTTSNEIIISENYENIGFGDVNIDNPKDEAYIDLCLSTTCGGIEKGLKTKTVNSHDYRFDYFFNDTSFSFYINYLISNLGNNENYTLQYETVNISYENNNENISFSFLHRSDNLVEGFEDKALELTYSEDFPNPVYIQQTKAIDVNRGSLSLDQESEIIEYYLEGANMVKISETTENMTETNSENMTETNSEKVTETNVEKVTETNVKTVTENSLNFYFLGSFLVVGYMMISLKRYKK